MPLLMSASVSFHTNDDDKNWDTVVGVLVLMRDEVAPVAVIQNHFATFRDHSDAGPFPLQVVTPADRAALERRGSVVVTMTPEGRDTWRFNILVDLTFDDGTHLLVHKNHIELSGNGQLVTSSPIPIEGEGLSSSNDQAVLTRVTAFFHTNDDNKNDDTFVTVTIKLKDNTDVAALVEDDLGEFPNHSDAEPQLIPIVRMPTTRAELRTGTVTIETVSNGQDTWRFNMLVEMMFEDGGALYTRANGIELVKADDQTFGIG
jgi:hypothetical protein